MIVGTCGRRLRGMTQFSFKLFLEQKDTLRIQCIPLKRPGVLSNENISGIALYPSIIATWSQLSPLENWPYNRDGLISVGLISGMRCRVRFSFGLKRCNS